MWRGGYTFRHNSLQSLVYVQICSVGHGVSYIRLVDLFHKLNRHTNTYMKGRVKTVSMTPVTV